MRFEVVQVSNKEPNYNKRTFLEMLEIVITDIEDLSVIFASLTNKCKNSLPNNNSHNSNAFTGFSIPF